jgi:hypothetical protein
MASRWHVPCAIAGSSRAGDAGSALTPVVHLPTGDVATPAARASSSLRAGRSGRSRSTNATTVGAVPSANSAASSAVPSCAASGSGDAVRRATNRSPSPSSSVRRSPLDSYVSSDQALHTARPLGHFGDREWGTSVIGSNPTHAARSLIRWRRRKGGSRRTGRTT